MDAYGFVVLKFRVFRYLVQFNINLSTIEVILLFVVDRFVERVIRYGYLKHIKKRFCTEKSNITFVDFNWNYLKK